jgi:hypothetical protein
MTAYDRADRYQTRKMPEAWRADRSTSRIRTKTRYVNKLSRQKAAKLIQIPPLYNFQNPDLTWVLLCLLLLDQILYPETSNQ